MLFRRGSRFHGFLDPQSGTAEHPIVYGAYGEGPQPVFHGSIDVSRSEDWTQVSEQVDAGGFTGSYEQVMQFLKSQPK